MEFSLRALAFFGGLVLACGAAFHVARGMMAETKKKVALAEPQSIVVAGGCFWGVQAVFQHTLGVTEAISGYAGGAAETANYDVVNSGKTGHAESVRVTFDPTHISLEQILTIYFTVAHNPTELNRQGPDTGPQYRSAVFVADDAQRNAAQKAIKAAQAHYKDRIVTQLTPLKQFFRAEDYHQNFYARHPNNPYICANDKPKVQALRDTFPDLYRA